MVTKSGKDPFRSFSALWCSEICKIILFHNDEHRVSPVFLSFTPYYIYDVLAISASYGLLSIVRFEQNVWKSNAFQYKKCFSWFIPYGRR